MHEDQHGRLDMAAIMKLYVHMNPHISISDIAYLMDMPYSPDIDETHPDYLEEVALQY